MGIIFSAFGTTTGRRKEIDLPELSALHLELLSLYASTVEDAMRLLQGVRIEPERTLERAVGSIGQRTLKRSEVTNDSEVQRFFNRANRPHLIFVCHKVQGQRTPLLDGKGLYTKFLDAALAVCEVVFILSEVPSVDYFHRLLSEQPTLNWLFQKKRIIPIFAGDIVKVIAFDACPHCMCNVQSYPNQILMLIIAAPFLVSHLNIFQEIFLFVIFSPSRQTRYWEPWVAEALQGNLPSLGMFPGDSAVEFESSVGQDTFVQQHLGPPKSGHGGPT
ncbi:unnamed protein product [Amoebophrya sp. A25]|nr:unnamed protein product [Amoebophrya sp. A25]|eukprot:GSA25T00017577001.1